MVPGLRLLEAPSGPVSNEEAVDQAEDPDDKRADIQEYGRVAGYHAEYVQQNGGKSTVAITQMVLGALVSLAVLSLLYRPYSRLMLAGAHVATRSRRSFAVFLRAIFVVPLLLPFLNG